MQMGKTTYGAGGSRRYGRRRLGASVTRCHRNRPLQFCRAAWSGCGVPAALSIIASTTRSTVARTPLLQFLKALSSDVRHRQARDISVGGLIAWRLAAPSPRQRGPGDRSKATSAARPEAALAAPSKARIAIVGAGIAGLNAALTLQDSGIASTVYEASNRIGGRMFSATSIWADNQVSEWCGELIDSDHETIIGLARRFGLPLDDFAENPSLRDVYKLFGRYYTVEQAYEDWRGGVQQAIAKDLEAAGESTHLRQVHARRAEA